MTDEERLEKLKERIANGQNALDFKNSGWQIADNLVRANLLKKLQSTSFEQDDERREVWRMLQVCDLYRNALSRIVRDGGEAEKEAKPLIQRIKEKLT